MDFDDDKHVLEMGSDVFRGKRQGPGLLEYNGDDVVADMSLPQQLAEGETKKRSRYQVKHEQVKHIVQEGTYLDFQVVGKRI